MLVVQDQQTKAGSSPLDEKQRLQGEIQTQKIRTDLEKKPTVSDAAQGGLDGGYGEKEVVERFGGMYRAFR